MFTSFLNDCQCTIPNEKKDYASVADRLSESTPVLVFMPMIFHDFSMLHVMNHADTRMVFSISGKEVVYVVPIGAHDFLWKRELDKAVADFYIRDEFPEFEDFAKYNLSFNESILLKHASLSATYDVPDLPESNIIYLSLNNNAGSTVHMFLLCETPENVWTTLADTYGINFDLIVDSHKGFGNHVQYTDIVRDLESGKSVCSRNALICKGVYAGVLPEEYSKILRVNCCGDAFTFYLPPWTDKQSAHKCEQGSRLLEKEKRDA